MWQPPSTDVPARPKRNKDALPTYVFPLTLNPSPPHAVIAMCSWSGSRTQPYACRLQDVFLASDSFGLIICTRHHPLSIITSRNNKIYILHTAECASVHTEANDDNDDS
jgi:hypothetical protein